MSYAIKSEILKSIQQQKVLHLRVIIVSYETISNN